MHPGCPQMIHTTKHTPGNLYYGGGIPYHSSPQRIQKSCIFPCAYTPYLVPITSFREVIQKGTGMTPRDDSALSSSRPGLLFDSLVFRPQHASGLSHGACPRVACHTRGTQEINKLSSGKDQSTVREHGTGESMLAPVGEISLPS